MKSQRPSAICPSCGIKLISPLWSEPVEADAVSNRWRCVICSSSFETIDHVDAAAWTMGVPDRAHIQHSLN
jgi:DNA-directed RNA polymerase subunit RPC12/RpoP